MCNYLFEGEIGIYHSLIHQVLTVFKVTTEPGNDSRLLLLNAFATVVL